MGPVVLSETLQIVNLPSPSFSTKSFTALAIIQNALLWNDRSKGLDKIWSMIQNICEIKKRLFGFSYC